MLKLSRLPNGEPEVFTSIQGEGVTAGLPSVFIRLALCNLRCTWCDTKYTWDWAHYDPEAEIVSLGTEDVATRVKSQGINNVVITGGEPMLQQGELVGLTAVLKTSQLRIEVETNGTITPDPQLAELVDQWNVSPKLANSGNDRGEREIAASLQWFATRPNAYFKFVIVELGDLDEVKALVCRYGAPARRVVLMPEGTDRDGLAQRSAWLADFCRDAGYRFSTRLHVLLWGDIRGR